MIIAARFPRRRLRRRSRRKSKASLCLTQNEFISMQIIDASQLTQSRFFSFWSSLFNAFGCLLWLIHIPDECFGPHFLFIESAVSNGLLFSRFFLPVTFSDCVWFLATLFLFSLPHISACQNAVRASFASRHDRKLLLIQSSELYLIYNRVYASRPKA